jgi:P27 family predicted phage terminase small subunit
MVARKKSTAAKKLAGTLRADRDTTIVNDIVATGAIQKPDGLSERESALWDHAVENAPKGLLAALDQHVLRTWVSATAIANEAAEVVAREGTTIMAPNKYVQKNPAFEVWQKATAAQSRASASLGFDPLARSKVKSELPPEPEYTRFVEFKGDDELQEMKDKGQLHPRNVKELMAKGRIK